jgi:hypothetical protein
MLSPVSAEGWCCKTTSASASAKTGGTSLIQPEQLNLL